MEALRLRVKRRSFRAQRIFSFFVSSQAELIEKRKNSAWWKTALHLQYLELFLLNFADKHFAVKCWVYLERVTLHRPTVAQVSNSLVLDSANKKSDV